MSTGVDERLDLSIIEALESDDAEECWSVNCHNTAEWLAIFTCGHAHPFCTVCKTFVTRMAAANKLVCSQTKRKQTIHVVRWEKK